MSIFNLFKPKWKHSNPDVAIKALETINDQATLYKIAISSANWGTCVAAVKRIDDEELLKKISTMQMKCFKKECSQGFNPRWEICEAAAEKISDQAFLRDMVFNEDLEWLVRCKVVETVQDPGVLLEIAVSKVAPRLRETVIKKMDGLDSLKQIAMETSDTELSKWRIEDEMDLLCSIINRIKDPHALAEIASTLADSNVKDKESSRSLPKANKTVWKVLDLLDEKLSKCSDELLLSVIPDCSDFIKKRIIPLISDVSCLIRIIESDASPKVKRDAIEQIDDQAVLADLAMSPVAGEQYSSGLIGGNSVYYLSQYIIPKITDQNLLIKIAKSDCDACFEAMSRIDKDALEDKELLDRIISREGAKWAEQWRKDEKERDEMKEAWELDRKYR